MRRFYISARYGRREEAEELAAQLVAMGYVVTSTWHLGEHWCLPEHQCADDDFRDVRAANTLIALTEESGAPGRNRGGRHVEYGLAMAWGHDLIVIGPRENVFHHRANVRQMRADELVGFLNRERNAAGKASS